MNSSPSKTDQKIIKVMRNIAKLSIKYDGCGNKNVDERCLESHSDGTHDNIFFPFTNIDAKELTEEEKKEELCTQKC